MTSDFECDMNVDIISILAARIGLPSMRVFMFMRKQKSMNQL